MLNKLYCLSLRSHTRYRTAPQKRSLLFLFLLLPLLLSCQVGGDSVESTTGQVRSNVTKHDLNLKTATTEDLLSVHTGTEQYWDGGEWGDQPVVSLELGVSEAAHEEAAACGLYDESIWTAVDNYSHRLTFQNGPAQTVFEAQNSSRETMWIKSLTVTALTDDVFLIECLNESP